MWLKNSKNTIVQDIKNKSLIVLTNINFQNFCLPLFGFWFPLHGFFFEVFLIFQLVYLEFFLFGCIFYFLFASEGEFCLVILMCTHLRTQMIGMNLGLFLALVEFEGWMFRYLDNLMGLNCIGKGMWKGRKIEETDAISSLTFSKSRFCIPTSLSTCVSPIPWTIGLVATAFGPCGIWWHQRWFIS